MKTATLGREVNGFTCTYHDNGIYGFQKKTDKGYELVECDEEQLTDGDIEYMTEHGFTLSKERIAKTQKRFLNKQKVSA